MIRHLFVKCSLFAIGFAASAVAQPYQIYGLDFSPIKHGQDPSTQITPAQIQERLAIVAPNVKWVRTYSSLNGLDQVCTIAHQRGLKCAMGAAICGTSSDLQELNALIAQAKNIDLAVIGTEALYKSHLNPPQCNVSSATLVADINQVRASAPGLPVTTADTYPELLDAMYTNPNFLPALDSLFFNIYPFYEQISIDNSVSLVNGWYQLLKIAAGAKPVIISETGWPDAGDPVGYAIASPSNRATYFLNFTSWARANNALFFYFEGFDEAWKFIENSQGPHFGIWAEDGTLKSGMSAVFAGKTAPDTWSGNNIPGGTGTPSLSFSYVPAFGSTEKLSGRLLHARPADYKIGCYIYAAPIWYVKPNAARRLTPVLADGTWSCDLAATGDTAEAKIGAFAFANGFTPPVSVAGDPPSDLIQNSVAMNIVARTQTGVFGLIRDASGRVLDGVTVALTGSMTETTLTSAGGKFAFYDLNPNGNYVVTPSLATATFAPSSQNLLNLTGVVEANFTLSGGTSTMTLDHPQLNFGVAAGGLITSPQAVTIRMDTGVNWVASSNQGNITVFPASGVGNGTFAVTAAPGPSGVVTVTAPAISNSPQQVQVNIVSTTEGNPFGQFETPADNSTGISGAVAVTGWALDNVEVTGVDIWRDPVGSEAVSPNGVVFIGNAVFVAGARPDVQAVNAGAPFSYRAGWGYLMLTTGLPPGGNGTYKLHAIAHNKAGTAVELGVKTITVDNAHSVKPFGTIDTPDQGATVSGSHFTNFGWALAQNPNCIPTNGSTLTVTVDGVALGHPVYNQARSDLAAAFPGRCNSGGAAGYFFIDTTALTNGVHTIGWLAYDDHGNGDGLGSRFFNVLNSSAGTAAPAEPIEAAQNLPERLEVEELDRVELKAGAVTGYLDANGQRISLPAGSTLKGGVFYWQLGPGFHGSYPLVFERADGSEVRVRVDVRPKRYGAAAR